MNRRIAVIIVHYRTPGLLRDCVASLQPQLDAARDEIIVIDNASPDGSAAELRNLSGITLIEHPHNVGFAGGNNIGFDHVRLGGGADYILLLNPDTVLRPNAVRTLLNFLESHPACGMVGPRLEHPDATPQLSAFGEQTPIGELIRGANIGPLSRLLKRWQVYGDIQSHAHRCDWLAGACVLMPWAVVEKVGQLDAKFFMYFEEVDYCRRARAAGFEIWHEPAAHVVHLVGQASGVTDAWSAKRLPAYWFESRHRYFRKHYGWLGAAIADLAWLTGHAAMRIRRLLTGVSHSPCAQRETRDLLAHEWRFLLGRTPTGVQS